MFRRPLFSFCAFSFLSTLFPVSASNATDLSLPIDVERAADAWEFVPEQVQVVVDEETKRKSFQPQVTKKTFTAAFTSQQSLGGELVLEADVRLTQDPATVKHFNRNYASIGVVAVDPATGIAVDREVTVSRGRFRDDESYDGGVNFTATPRPFSFKPRFSLNSVSPLMADSIRTVLEQTAHPLPSARRRVHRLRLEVRNDLMRGYVNGRFVGEGPRPAGEIKARLKLGDQVRVLDFRIRSLETPNAAFVPVPLDDFCNAKGLGTPAGLPAERGGIAEIDGVPFVTSRNSSGEDHVDLEPSVYLHRLGIFTDGDSRESVFGPEDIERARFTMRVPERTYRRAWVLAGFDGDVNSTPILTVRFYKPKTGWAVDATANVPLLQTTTSPIGAKRIPLEGGRVSGQSRAVWLLPIELDAAALATEPMVCLELSKEMHAYRSWPDPAYYGSYPGGLPSGVHVFGLTLEEAPVWARGTGGSVGNTYVDPETPSWRVLLERRSAKPLRADVQIRVTDPFGRTTEHRREAVLKDRTQQEVRFEPKAEAFGLYTVETIVSVDDFKQSRTGTFLRLPKSTRTGRGSDSRWGVWCWAGTHDTLASIEENARLLKAVGAVNCLPLKESRRPEDPHTDLYDFRQKEGFGIESHRLVPRTLPAWSAEPTLNRAAYDAYVEEKGREARDQLTKHRDLKYVNFFAENMISLRVTHGMSPWAMGQPYFDYLPVEADRIRAHWLTALAAREGVKKHAPELKIIFGHGAGNFAQPFFRLDEWKNDLFDGFGMDLPQFERMPERQPRATEPSLLYFLHHQMQEKGLAGKKEVVHLESYFPSSGPMALTFDQQADSVVRTAVLSMALGTTKFMQTWSLSTCADGWGSSHYGCVGLYDRLPDHNPKPAAAAFATMTQVLDQANYDGWLETGSRSAFCLRFRDEARTVYALWTIRGTRPLELKTSGKAKFTRYDSNGNAYPVEVVDGRATVALSSSPQWIVATDGAIESAQIGSPTYAEAPAERRIVLEDFEQHGWRYDPAADERYQTNHWDMPREPGKFEVGRGASEAGGSQALQVNMLDADPKKPMVGFYGMFVPPKPISIPGKAEALGMYVTGRSAWNRFVYEVVDAKGETWRSCGTRDAWNCDDIHSWSSANFDGRRYLRFPLPSTAPGDGFREPDAVWWGSDAEGIVDLPLKLTRIFVEMRPQMIYVDKMLPIDDYRLEFDDLVAEYASDENMTDAPAKRQRSAAGVLNKKPAAPLPNPFAALQETGTGRAPKIAKVFPPPEVYDGTRLIVEVEPQAQGVKYRGYVAAHADGSGAKPLGVDQTSTHKLAKSLTAPNHLLFDKLQAARPMYFFVTTVDAEGKESKPSAIREVVLKDEFPFK